MLAPIDISMPGMYGIEAAALIRRQANGRHLKIVAVAANVADRQRNACRTAGFDAFLAKPLEMKTLLATVRVMIG